MTEALRGCAYLGTVTAVADAAERAQRPESLGSVVGPEREEAETLHGVDKIMSLMPDYSCDHAGEARARDCAVGERRTKAS